MQHSVKFDHSKTTQEAFGISKERFDEIKEFTDFYLPKICVGKTRSEVFQEILEFVDTPVEAMIIYGKIEHDLGRNRSGGKIEVEFVGGDLDDAPIPPEIKEMIKADIKNIDRQIKAEKKNTPGNIQDN